MVLVHSDEQKSIGLKFSKSRTGSHVTYSCHHNSSRFTCPIIFRAVRLASYLLIGVGGVDRTALLLLSAALIQAFEHELAVAFGKKLCEIWISLNFLCVSFEIRYHRYQRPIQMIFFLSVHLPACTQSRTPERIFVKFGTGNYYEKLSSLFLLPGTIVIILRCCLQTILDRCYEQLSFVFPSLP